MQPWTADVPSEVADLLQTLGREYHKSEHRQNFMMLSLFLDLLSALSDDTNVSFSMCTVWKRLHSLFIYLLKQL